MNDKNTTVCFTGHRTVPPQELSALQSALYSTVASLILRGYQCFVCGGALGFDTLAAECVINLKKRFPHIRLCLVLPCRNQTEKWVQESDLIRYKEIAAKADITEYTRAFYTDGCMLERNRRMVDISSVCIAYLKQKKGGTQYTYSYALSKKLEVINLAEGIAVLDHRRPDCI